MVILYLGRPRIKPAWPEAFALKVVVKKILYPKLDGPPTGKPENYMFLADYVDEAGSVATAKIMVRSVPEVVVGGCYQLDGDWKRGPRGDEFNAWCMIPWVPETYALGQIFLSSLLPPEQCGTSNLTRRFGALCRQYGQDVLLRALATPTILRSLSDDPDRFQANILRFWESATRESHMAITMHRAGFTIGDLDMVFRGCGYKVSDRVGGDPYQLVSIPGVDVAKADMLFRQTGGHPYDPRRIAGIIRRSLMASEGLSASNEEGEKTGFIPHVEFPGSTAVDVTDILTSGIPQPQRDDLVSGIDPKLGIRLDALRDFLAKPEEALKYGLRVRKSKDGRTLVSREAVYQVENRLTRNIGRLLNAPPLRDEETVKRTCAALFQQPEFQRFDTVQRTAVEMACHERISIITGGPGTGKSTILEAIIAARVAMGAEKRSFLLAAPTATAALRMTETTGMDAATIQALLKYRGDSADGIPWFTFNRSNPLPSGCNVYMDEGSMADVFIADSLVDAIPSDASLLILGDDGQLQSVGAGAFLENCLNTRSATYGSRVIPAICLENTYRSNPNSNLALQAKEIRHGGVPALTSNASGGTSMHEVTSEKIAPFVVHAMTKVMPSLGNKDPLMDVAILGPQNPGLGGLWEINKAMSATFNRNGAPIPGLSLPRYARDMPLPRIGDRVMRRKNVKGDKLCVNGSRGFITRYNPAETGDTKAKASVTIRFDNGEERDEQINWDWVKRFEVAYAITIHKSQGQQYRYVLLIATPEHSNMLDNSLVYTGWTRGKEGVAVVGSFDAFANAVQRSRINTRLTMLTDLLADVMLPKHDNEFRNRWFRRPDSDNLPKPGGRERWFQTKYGNTRGHNLKDIPGLAAQASQPPLQSPPARSAPGSYPGYRPGAPATGGYAPQPPAQQSPQAQPGGYGRGAPSGNAPVAQPPAQGAPARPAYGYGGYKPGAAPAVRGEQPLASTPPAGYRQTGETSRAPEPGARSAAAPRPAFGYGGYRPGAAQTTPEVRPASPQPARPAATAPGNPGPAAPTAPSFSYGGYRPGVGGAQQTPATPATGSAPAAPGRSPGQSPAGGNMRPSFGYRPGAAPTRATGPAPSPPSQPQRPPGGGYSPFGGWRPSVPYPGNGYPQTDTGAQANYEPAPEPEEDCPSP